MNQLLWGEDLDLVEANVLSLALRCGGGGGEDKVGIPGNILHHPRLLVPVPEGQDTGNNGRL